MIRNFHHIENDIDIGSKIGENSPIVKQITPIQKFKDGNKVQGFYLCIEKHLRHTRSGELYLDLLLRDCTGQITAKVWEKVEEYQPKFSSGDPVAASGIIESFHDRLQLIVKRINKATIQSYARFGFDPALVVPTSKKDPKKMWKKLMTIAKGIDNKYLRKLVGIVYRENKKELMTHPASILSHYNYRSGLLENILNMATIGASISSLFEINRDLLMTGIFLHDIGKLKELSGDLETESTDEGNFLGHAVLSRDILLNVIKIIKDFPPSLKLQLEHMILAHRGRLEWRDSLKPNNPEALLLHYIHNMDKQMNLMKKYLEEDAEDGNWTTRNNPLHIPLYKKQKKN